MTRTCPDCGGRQEMRVHPANGEPFLVLCHCYSPEVSALDAVCEELGPRCGLVVDTTGRAIEVVSEEVSNAS